ncbi:HNH endonuclease signature motif containing protein [Pseudomonas sp.]|uniref:HNH endonuclease signature motif containing protein n=1 Tax=Pseudomonas sp. TaxID=306 RepID=UPI002ED82277
MNDTLPARFWAKVIKADGCWKWSGSKHSFGYGMIMKGGDAKKTKITASRASWLIHFGEIPEGLHVCHKCDNPECTNPDHLFLGTARDNSQDCIAKERRAMVFSQVECDIIHTLFTLGVSNAKLMRAFQVYRRTISSAIERGGMLPPIKKNHPKPRTGRPKSPPPLGIGSKNGRAKIGENDVLKIRAMRADGLSTGEIAKHFSIGKSMVSHICTRRCWKHI